MRQKLFSVAALFHRAMRAVSVTRRFRCSIRLRSLCFPSARTVAPAAITATAFVFHFAVYNRRNRARKRHAHDNQYRNFRSRHVRTLCAALFGRLFLPDFGELSFVEKHNQRHRNRDRHQPDEERPPPFAHGIHGGAHHVACHNPE